MPESEVMEAEVIEDEFGDAPEPARGTAVPQDRAIATSEFAPNPLAVIDDDEFEVLVQQQARVRKRIIRVQREAMQKGVDYGVIPGTKNPTLLKAGAEVLIKMLGAVADYDPPVREIVVMGTAQHLTYRVRCRIMKGDTILGIGDGSCSTLEPKYRYRNEGLACPECGFELRRSNQAEEWFCWRKRGGCGATFPLSQLSSPGKVENPDALGLDNTVLKIAKKRAKVDAALDACAASGTFTQDIEEQPPTEPPPTAEPEPSGDEPPPPGDADAPPPDKGKVKSTPKETAPSRDEVKAYMKDALGVSSVNEAHQAFQKGGIKATKANTDEHGRIRLDKLKPADLGRAMKVWRSGS